MKSLRTKVLVSLAAVAAIAAGTIGFTANADSAADFTRIYTKGSGGSLAFHPNGDNFEIEDLKKDGRSVRAIYTINGQGNDYMWNTKGAHTTKWHNRDFREGTKMKMMVCLAKNGTPIGSTCSDWKSIKA